MKPEYPPEDEHYRFLRLYALDLEMVKESLEVLRRYRRRDIRNCILRDIIVAYARPFSGNQGENFSSHQLKIKYVPAGSRLLHKFLIDHRNKLLAHSDYTFHRPKVMKRRHSHGVSFPMSFAALDYQFLESNLREIEHLVSDVAGRLVVTISKFQERP
jgi:hypothetical protein